MNKSIGTKKRIMGVTLAALTVVAGMSAVAFAGEPEVQPMAAVKLTAATTVNMSDIKANDGKEIPAFKINEGNVIGMKKIVLSNREMTDLKTTDSVPVEMVMEAKEIKTKVDEETGVMYYSVDEGKTWTEMETSGEGVAAMTCSIAPVKEEIVTE